MRLDVRFAPLRLHLVEAADLIAFEAQHRVRPLLSGRHVLSLPAEQLAVERFGARRIGRRQINPAEGPRLVALSLAMRFSYLPLARLARGPYHKSTEVLAVPK